ncbi:bifunctional triacylglycerol lipase/ester hydrolase NDAI_0B05830 [Naumovozyma dairenensis CBS 421]|uniref:Lipid droplet-associated hydrolase n=1 Tax=Naumovozyma dairenensis (strain ATCC 10597 / BCRC 20456 / CBS 421 / NBRC 0211 / NRRL Y-12639) TaxID=1071378 RepID=G0W755_NAUDC|nr:hypothetical protein NDAI_0B05830 [Naumovozyma dairenensis CBS 421]CCD23616.1 hypothetical protein NDAI_0B05830 [Naumovozyma dairenensis CBS 421]
MLVKSYSESKYPTSIIHIEAEKLIENDPSLNPLFIWIPGNPGILQYYQQFLCSLHKKHPHWEILAIPHAGMDTSLPVYRHPNDRIYHLNEQIEHKIEVITTFLTKANSSDGIMKKRPLVIMGHSVGTYMIQRMVLTKEFQDTILHNSFYLKKIGFITPTIIDINLSSKGILISHGLQLTHGYLPYILSYLSYFVFSLILKYFDNIRRRLIAYIMGCQMTDFAAIGTEILLTNSVLVKQSLGLASIEMQEIRKNWDVQKQFVENCNHNDIQLWLLFCETDHWVNNVTRTDLIKFYQSNYKDISRLQIEVSSEFPHSFVVNHSDWVVERFF